ncbi:hypothetical protein [Nitrosopumilus piranensis]|nr:hypothetical protein [Nitrosopumilus piranensis]
MVLPIMFGILLIPSIGMSFASHGDDESSSGGGCDGDCTHPTLGKDSSGIVFVEGGFTINGKTYDVENFEQTIPTQIIKTGEPVEISLKIFDNSGPQYLKHVELVLGNEHVFDSYVWRQMPIADIAWSQTFDGIESVEITNTENLITDVSVEAKIDGAFNVLKFQFTPTTTFDTSHIMVKMWDQNRSYWLNNFYDALEISTNPFVGDYAKEEILSTESEIHQITSEELDEESVHEDEHKSHDDHTEDLHCSDGYTAILDNRFGSAYCTLDNFAIALIESGLATTI